MHAVADHANCSFSLTTIQAKETFHLYQFLELSVFEKLGTTLMIQHDLNLVSEYQSVARSSIYLRQWSRTWCPELSCKYI